MRPLLLFFLLLNFSFVHAQEKIDWDINYVSTGDTVPIGEYYSAYIVVKNKSVKESDISIEANGVKLKKDALGRFRFEIKGNTASKVHYVKVEQLFKVKCSDPNFKPYLFVRSYYVNSRKKVISGDDVITVDGTPENVPADVPEKEDQDAQLYVPVMPEFIASAQYQTFYDYLKSEIKANQIKSSGTLFVQFNVNKDGSITFRKLLKGDIAPKDLEKLVTIINNSPKWNPGKDNNIPVKIKKVWPIRFE